MRDDFSEEVKRTLNLRVASRCSNPNCRVRTSGPSQNPTKYVNVGVAAHIAAASPGGPRYDASQLPAERSAASNGIWLCQTCSKLIDSDAVQFTVSLLHDWKRKSEATAIPGAIDQPIESQSLGRLLNLGTAADRGLLAYADLTIDHIGRERELNELNEFLADPATFSWWLWTGPAGIGKSRLALELCRRVPGDWDAGFLGELSQDHLLETRVTRPTLIVVDYAAQRSKWISDSLLSLSRRDPAGPPVRVLILERAASGSWWENVQRLHRYSESLEIANCRYALARPMSGLHDEEIERIVDGVARSRGRILSRADREDILEHSKKIDSYGRPLFAVIAAIDWMDSSEHQGTRDEVLKQVLVRTEAQLANAIAEPAFTRQAKNLLCYATSIGGISFDSYAQDFGNLQERILPDPFNPPIAAPLEAFLAGIEPDILGELFVLERLNSEEPAPASTKILIEAAWRTHPEAYCAFVERVASDHTEHRHLGSLLQLKLANSQEKERWAELAASTIPHLRRSDHPLIQYLLQGLSQLKSEMSALRIGVALATAHFRIGNLLLNEADLQRAEESFSRALSIAKPDWAVHANSLNNLGIVHSELGETARAYQDFTIVIDSAAASDESRACSLNNRADLHDSKKEFTHAISDRSSVLSLKETTYNRRYIAHYRRSRALWKTGQTDLAFADIEAILDSRDIAVEQKMSALLLKAEYLREVGKPKEALECITAILGSYRNFDDVVMRAQDFDAELKPSQA
ncbi:tetratricopeptide repeat protein [Kitasatospora sp. NPDC056731]|uniref:tetratricopeptide repeat protein n=1 Tax=Kitasatospora sp. NPDC056731 TaxID=3155422 RepID=UPI0034429FD2